MTESLPPTDPIQQARDNYRKVLRHLRETEFIGEAGLVDLSEDVFKATRLVLEIQDYSGSTSMLLNTHSRLRGIYIQGIKSAKNYMSWEGPAEAIVGGFMQGAIHHTNEIARLLEARAVSNAMTNPQTNDKQTG